VLRQAIEPVTWSAKGRTTRVYGFPGCAVAAVMTRLTCGHGNFDIICGPSERTTTVSGRATGRTRTVVRSSRSCVRARWIRRVGSRCAARPSKTSHLICGCREHGDPWRGLDRCVRPLMWGVPRSALGGQCSILSGEPDAWTTLAAAAPPTPGRLG
jgi:hypothetical protein